METLQTDIYSYKGDSDKYKDKHTDTVQWPLITSILQ